MVPVRTSLAASLVALVLLLAVLTALGLAPLPAVVGLLCGVVLCAAVHRGVAAAGISVLGPADVVTLSRSVLACALAALVVDPSVVGPAAAAVLPLAVVALLLDAVDGRVARATRTESAFGRRFDGEADAFLLLVLSVLVAASYGWWVLTIGAARYAFALAGRVVPRLRGALPFRYWRKVVTAAQGIALVVAAAGVLPRPVNQVALVAALALLAESFGRDVLWLWRARPATAALPDRAPDRAGLRLP